MKLKSIEIQGFKSFDDKTIINFDDSITCIVGPNGCGKSNIVDAIRWVMGEQSAKHLRGRAMEDIIFSGTQERPANSLAQVEITFNTKEGTVPAQYTGYPQVSISRKLFRTGESEYCINKKPVRLKDITDFFLGTGVGTKAYSIIEQDRVSQIVMSKPESRRGIIEEAASISKFKTRKEAALRKMDSTKQNLSRLNDILLEIDRQKATLERQAKKAQKFKVVKDELKDLDLKLAAIDFEKLDTTQKDCIQKLKECGEQEESLNNKVTENETWIENERLKLVTVESQLNDLQQAVFENDNALKLGESKIQTKKEEILRCQKDIEQNQRELEELRMDFTGSKNGVKQVNQKLAITELDCVASEETVGNQEQKLNQLETANQELFNSLQNSREELNTAQNEITQITTQKENLHNRINELKENLIQDQNELTELTGKQKSMDKLLQETKKELQQIKQLKLSLGEKTDSLTDNLKEEETKLAQEQETLTGIKEELLNKKSRLHSLEELQRNFEGYQDGPRHILKGKKEGDVSGVDATVAEIIETESSYENAVSAILGERMQYLIVNNQQDGLHCAEFLKTAQAGRSSFISASLDYQEPHITQRTIYTAQAAANTNNIDPHKKTETDLITNLLSQTPEPHHETLESAEQVEQPETKIDYKRINGVKGLLKDFVNLKDGYQKLSHLLFGDVLLVDNLHNALEAWHDLKRPTVTLDGEIISQEGIITGGTEEQTSKALLEKKRETKELEEIIQNKVNQVKTKEETCFDLNRKIKTLKADIEEIKSSAHAKDVKFAEQEKDVLHYTKDLENMTHRIGKLTQQIEETTKNTELFGQQKEELEANLSQHQAVFDKAQLFIDSNQAQEEKCRQELGQLKETHTHEKIKLAQLKEQKSFLTQELDRLSAEQIRLQQDIIKTEESQILSTKKKLFLEDRLEFLEKTIQKIIANKQQVDEDYTQQKNQFEELNNQILEREHHLKQERHEHNQIKDDINQNTVLLTETRGLISRLGEQIMERYQLTMSESYQDYKPNSEEQDFDREASKQRAEELRKKLSGLGNVNLAAIDELEEITDRFEFLSGQQQDLEQSLDALEKAIHKINKTTRERFKNTFDLVNEKFTKLFPRLFKGGHAYLQLTDPENILETGVEIIAQPPGKKLQSISLLSGGEKALTAVSLLFAIFLIKPSPFCLLDEVDAPLDDTNVDRYNEIVKEMALRTQFIVITHNKRTMQVSPCLFGVTMQEAGVSKLVSVSIDD